MYIVAGLGNPGSAYKNTRHNVGFMVIDHLAHEHVIKPGKKSGTALVGKGTIAGKNVVLMTPTTFMNNSGLAVKEVVRYYKLDIDRLVVVYDDLDIDFGKVRVRTGGGSGGHNGIKSIITHTGAKDFIRVRIGVGRPPGRMDPSDFVLSVFKKYERAEIELAIAKASNAVEYIIESGVEKAMNKFNTEDRISQE